MRIVVLGGGFGGVATVRHLERVLRRQDGPDFVSTRGHTDCALKGQDARCGSSRPLNLGIGCASPGPLSTTHSNGRG